MTNLQKPAQMLILPMMKEVKFLYTLIQNQKADSSVTAFLSGDSITMLFVLKISKSLNSLNPTAQGCSLSL